MLHSCIVPSWSKPCDSPWTYTMQPSSSQPSSTDHQAPPQPKSCRPGGGVVLSQPSAWHSPPWAASRTTQCPRKPHHPHPNSPNWYLSSLHPRFFQLVQVHLLSALHLAIPVQAKSTPTFNTKTGEWPWLGGPTLPSSVAPLVLSQPV